MLAATLAHDEQGLQSLCRQLLRLKCGWWRWSDRTGCKRKAACFRWGSNKRLRDAFHTLADSTRHHNPWAQDLYAQAIARGHDHPRALRTVGLAWCRIVWRCWQDGVPYDPARHRALQRHITVTIPTPSGPLPDLAATQRMAGAAVTQKGGPQGRARSA